MAQMVDRRRENKTSIKSLRDRDGEEISDAEQMCTASCSCFYGSTTILDFSLHLPAAEAWLYEKPINAAEI